MDALVFALERGAHPVDLFCRQGGETKPLRASVVAFAFLSVIPVRESACITINAVCPGTINTPMVAEMIAKDPEAMNDIMKMQPTGRLGTAEEVASAVLWLCSPGAAFVVGHALAVDGDFTAQ